MHLADTLSRAAIKASQEEQSSFQRELEMICTISNGVEDKQLEEIRQKTKEDATMQAVIDLVKRAVPIPARPYFNVRDEMVIEGGVLYKGDRCIIPVP